MSRSSYLLLPLMVLLLSGCAMQIADRIKNQERLEKSSEAYRNCLGQNLSAPERCKALKEIYDADRAIVDR